jgi:hypothetical protein
MNGNPTKRLKLLCSILPEVCTNWDCQTIPKMTTVNNLDLSAYGLKTDGSGSQPTSLTCTSNTQQSASLIQWASKLLTSLCSKQSLLLCSYQKTTSKRFFRWRKTDLQLLLQISFLLSRSANKKLTTVNHLELLWLSSNLLLRLESNRKNHLQSALRMITHYSAILLELLVIRKVWCLLTRIFLLQQLRSCLTCQPSNFLK